MTAAAPVFQARLDLTPDQARILRHAAQSYAVAATGMPAALGLGPARSGLTDALVAFAADAHGLARTAAAQPVPLTLLQLEIAREALAAYNAAVSSALRLAAPRDRDLTLALDAVRAVERAVRDALADAARTGPRA